MYETSAARDGYQSSVHAYSGIPDWPIYGEIVQWYLYNRTAFITRSRVRKVPST